MIEIAKKWRRWSGPPSELVRASELAANVLSGWTGLSSVVTVQVEDRAGVTEKATGVEALISRHARELSHLSVILIQVEEDRDERIEQRTDARRRGEEPGPIEAGPEVRIRVTQYGTSLVVGGEDRTKVEGLVQRLVPVLSRGASNAPGVPRDAMILLGAVLAAFGIPLGVAVTRWLDLSTKNDRWETSEILGMAGGLGIGVAIASVMWWLFPPVEVLPEAGVGRARRFRGAAITLIGALVLAVAGSFVYDQLK